MNTDHGFHKFLKRMFTKNTNLKMINSTRIARNQITSETKARSWFARTWYGQIVIVKNTLPIRWKGQIKEVVKGDFLIDSGAMQNIANDIGKVTYFNSNEGPVNTTDEKCLLSHGVLMFTSTKFSGGTRYNVNLMNVFFFGYLNK